MCKALDDWDWPKQVTSQPRFKGQGNGLNLLTRRSSTSCGKGLKYKDRELFKCLGRKSNIPRKPPASLLRCYISTWHIPEELFLLRLYLTVTLFCTRHYSLKGKSEETGPKGERKTLPVSTGLYCLSTPTNNTPKPLLWPLSERSKLPCPSPVGQPRALLWLMRRATSKDLKCAHALSLCYCTWATGMRKTYPGKTLPLQHRANQPGYPRVHELKINACSCMQLKLTEFLIN